MTTSTYSLTKKDLTSLKSRLTRAQNSGNPEKIIAECDRAFQIFEEKGTPDNWHTWNIAREDARFALARQNQGW